MIKFFRKIRQNLLSEGKTAKYLKYAIGEIILVVIGILIALGINNKNISRIESKKEVLMLKNLKNDLKADLKRLNTEDSLYAILESKTAKSINLFYKAKTTKDIGVIDELNDAMWNVLYVNNNTHLEMINSGSMYNMTNKILQEKIIAHYLNLNANKVYINEVNDEQAFLFDKSPDLYPYKFLVNQLKNPKIDITTIDTTWINNPNSPTYLAVEHYLDTKQRNSNTYRRTVFKRIIQNTKNLITEINNELNSR